MGWLGSTWLFRIVNGMEPNQTEPKLTLNGPLQLGMVHQPGSRPLEAVTTVLPHNLLHAILFWS